MSSTLAVVSQTGESLSFYDIESGERVAHLDSLTSEPHELCYDKNRKLLYMSHTYRYGHYWNHGEYSHKISIVDTQTKEMIEILDTSPAKGPHGLYLDYKNDILYASVEQLDVDGGGVIGIDLKTHKIIKQVPSHYTSHWFIMTPDGSKAYTCNKTASFISVLDLVNQKLLSKIDIPEGTEELSVSTDGRFVYVPTPGFKGGQNPSDPKIEVIDTSTDKIVKSIPMKNGALPVHISPTGLTLVGQYFFAPNSTAIPTEFKQPKQNGALPSTSPIIQEAVKDKATLAIYSPENDHELLAEIEIGLWPLTIRCSDDGRTAFVANVVHGSVSVIDLESRSVVRTIVVDDQKRKDKPMHVGAHGLAYIP